MGRISRLFMTNPVKGFAGGENLLQTDDKGSTWTIASADCEINDLFFQANKKTDGFARKQERYLQRLIQAQRGWNKFKFTVNR